MITSALDDELVNLEHCTLYLKLGSKHLNTFYSSKTPNKIRLNIWSQLPQNFQDISR